MERESSLLTDSASSTQSNINITSKPSTTRLDSSEIEQVASSTPPTSIDPTPSVNSIEHKNPFSRKTALANGQANGTLRGSGRTSVKPGFYNLKKLAGTDIHTPTKFLQGRPEGSTTRKRKATDPASADEQSSVSIQGKVYATLDRWLTSQASQARKPIIATAVTPKFAEKTEESIVPEKRSNKKRKREGGSGSQSLRHIEVAGIEMAGTCTADQQGSKHAPPPRQKDRLEKKPGATARPISSTERRRSRRVAEVEPESAKVSNLLRSLEIDMVDVSPQELREKEALVSVDYVTKKKRRWRGWVEVDEDGNEIVPELTDKDDPDEQQESKRRKLCDDNESTAFPGLLHKIVDGVTSAVKGVSSAFVGKNSEQPQDKPLHKRYHKRMETKGKFYSGQPADEIFPMPHNFFMAKFGPDDALLKPKDMSRTYKLSAEVFNPLNEIFARDIKDWHVTRGNKNTFVGNAKHTWVKSDLAKLPDSVCICTPADPCDDETCWNRSMGYECNDSNCRLGADKCKNRPFSDLSRRIDKTEAVNNRQRELEKARADKAGRRPNFHSVLMSFDQGVEVFKTPGKGFGVRTQRSFEPGQIIMEYFGEIIDDEEKFRRMATVYKDSTDFYMMKFINGFTLDATKGSMARFVNHSCDPNCEIRQMQVRSGEGKKASVEPRMALFAVDYIKFGDELTYDYNFENFNEENKQKCLCGADNCRGFLGPRPAKERSKDKKEKKKETKTTAAKKRKSN